MSAPDDDRTKQTAMPAVPDDEPTAAHAELGVVAELRAAFGDGGRKTLPLYSLPDTIVVGRGSAADWQIDDDSLSRKHCQFKWNGRELTVEDLGSANGTRVGGRPARSPLPVGKDDVVHLGTVMITLVPLWAAPKNPDEQATRIVAAPAGAPGAGTGSHEVTGSGAHFAASGYEVTPGREVTPGPEVTPPPLDPIATVVRHAEPTGEHGAATTDQMPAQPRLFRPPSDAAGPDEPTRQWDVQAVLMRAPEKSLDARELWERTKAAWKQNRRPFVLAGAAVWVAILLALLSWKEKRNAAEEQEQALISPVDTAPAPARPTEPKNIVEPSVDRDRDLADAVAAYDQGRLDEALRLFRRLATDPDDKAAQFMVQLIESRAGESKATP